LAERDPALTAVEQAPDVLVMPQDDEQRDAGDEVSRRCRRQKCGEGDRRQRRDQRR
jgi:hypothetical protein